MEAHEYAKLFPLLGGAELQDLADDIATNGLQEPIVLYFGKILDGRNRLQACEKAGVNPETVEYGDVIDDPLAYVLSHNLHRRHLDTSQRAMIGVELKRLEAERAKKRLVTSTGGSSPQPVENFPQAATGKARDLAARILNVSGKSIDMAETVTAQGEPELQDAVLQGNASVSAAAKISTLSPEAQHEAVSEGKRGVANAARLAGTPDCPFDCTGCQRHGCESRRSECIPPWKRPENQPKKRRQVITKKVKVDLRDPARGAIALITDLDRHHLQNIVAELFVAWQRSDGLHHAGQPCQMAKTVREILATEVA